MTKEDYDWTSSTLDDQLDTATLVKVAGVRDVDGEVVEQLAPGDSLIPDFYSVYIYRRVPDSPLEVAEVVADRATYDEALAFARMLAAECHLKLIDAT